MSGTIYAFANQKGGVGKTTTAVNIGAFLAWQGQHVLLIDLDPQANATASMGVDRFALSASMYDVFTGDTPLREILLPTSLERLTLAPSTSMLAGVEIELANTADREFILRHALHHVADSDGTEPQRSFHSFRDEYNHILIDSPPSLGVLTVNALSAADYVVVPVQCEYLALEGLAQLMQTITLVRENLNPNLELFGLVMTMFDPRARLATQVIQEVRNHFPNELFETLIPRNVRVAEAPGFGEPLVKFDIHSRGAEAYEKLTNEFLMRQARLASRVSPIAYGISQIADSGTPAAEQPLPYTESQTERNESQSPTSKLHAPLSHMPTTDGDTRAAISDTQFANSEEQS